MFYRKTSGGFTLIEVLIAMTLLGVMVVLLFSSMKICADSWQKGEDKITEVNDVAVVYQFFRNHLTTAVPLWDDFSDKENKLHSFQGTNQTLQFVSSFPASAKKAGLQRFSLKLLQEGNEQSIQVSITPFFPVSKGEEWREEEVTLLRHVKSFSLTYFRSDQSQVEAFWQEDWQAQEAMPDLVKIKIERDGDIFWPEIIVELKSKPMQQLNAGDQNLNNSTNLGNNPLLEGGQAQ